MDTTDLEIVAQALRAGWDRRPFSGECFDALERIQDRISELEGLISPRNSIPLEDLLGPIKPCPFCGSANVFNDDGMAILCRNCDAQAGVMAWQFRAPQN